VTVLYTWDSSAPRAGGGGVADTEDRAKQDADKWMLKHHAETARLAEVTLVLGGWGMSTIYSPPGRRCTGCLHGDQVTWTPWAEPSG